MLVLRLTRTIPAQEFCGFISRSIDCIRLGKCVACLSDDIPRRIAGGRSGAGLADSGLDRYPCAERARTRGRSKAAVRAGGRDCRGIARRWIGVLDRGTSAPRAATFLLVR